MYNMNGSKPHCFVKAEGENEVSGEVEQCLYSKRKELRDVCLMTWLQVNIQAKDNSNQPCLSSVLLN